MSDTTTQVPHIKADAQISLLLGTQIVLDLQSTMVYVVGAHTEQEVHGIVEKVNRQEPLADWEQATITLMRLLTGIHQSAEAGGFIEFRPVESVLGTL